MEKNIIIGTAGHIDHGKTTLIKALTGDETDRLVEEKERGISIEIGFSHLQNERTAAENLNLGIVDVPGHEKFVNKMLSAAAGVDLALIIAAADEGVMPQTKEHLAILNLLGVDKAIIVLTKIDLVENEWIQLIEEDLKDHLKNTFAEKAEIIRVSSKNQQGIRKLKELIIDTAVEMKQREKSEPAYFPVDRIFSLKGHGTVVTGTLFSGELNQGEELCLYPAEKKLKIRKLESHGRELKQFSAGSRVGINLRGIEKSEIKRGDIIAEKNSLLTSRYFEGELKLLEDLNFSLKNGDQIHFHTAAMETTGRIYLYKEKEAFAGEKVYIKLILGQEAALFFKQKFVLRRFSPLQTIGGGEILEIDPLPARKKDESKIIDNLKKLKSASRNEAVEIFIKQQQHSPAVIDLLKKKTALKTKNLKETLNNLAAAGKIVELISKKSYIHQQRLNKLENYISKIAADYHQQYNLRPGIKKEELRSKLKFNLNIKELDSLLKILESKDIIEENNNLISNKNFKITLSQELQNLRDEIISIYQDNLFSPPVKKDIIDSYQLEENFFDYLEAEGYLIRLSSELYFHQSVFREVKKKLAAYFEANQSLNLAEFRDLIESSRRYALPLLEKLDQLGITRRAGDLRYPAQNIN